MRYLSRNAIQVESSKDTVQRRKNGTRHSPAGEKPAVGCHYLPSQPQGITAHITAHKLVPNYTAWWQRKIGVNNLHRVSAQRCAAGHRPHDLSIAGHHSRSALGPPLYVRLLRHHGLSP